MPQSKKRRYILGLASVERRVIEDIKTSAPGTRVDIGPAKRSLDQNALMWSRLHDIARQLVWTINNTVTKMSAEDWKDVLTAGYITHKKMETRWAMNPEGVGAVALGLSTSRMAKVEMSEFLDYIDAFAADGDVVWSPTSIGGYHEG